MGGPILSILFVCSFGAEVYGFGACEGDRRYFESGEAEFGGRLGRFGWFGCFSRTIMSMQISVL